MISKRIWGILLGLLTLTLTVAVVFVRFLLAPDPPPDAESETGVETRIVARAEAYEIVREYPHDPQAFTQALIYLDGFLYESTGLTGKSSLRKVKLETGEVLLRRAVDPRDFAEGLTEWRGKLVQLTPRRQDSWSLDSFAEDFSRQAGRHLGWTYDVASLEPRSSFRYAGEGWGLTHDEGRLILSDGSSSLRFLDPETFKDLGRLEVSSDGEPVTRLNELEFVDGMIYANVWGLDRIAIIPPDGKIKSWIDLSGLRSHMPPLPTSGPQPPVLNGIAYDPVGRRLFVTGKYWPKIFEIRLEPQR